MCQSWPTIQFKFKRDVHFKTYAGIKIERVWWCQYLLKTLQVSTNAMHFNETIDNIKSAHIADIVQATITKFSSLIPLTFGNNYWAWVHKPQKDVVDLVPVHQRSHSTADWIGTVSICTTGNSLCACMCGSASSMWMIVYLGCTRTNSQGLENWECCSFFM